MAYADPGSTSSPFADPDIDPATGLPWGAVPPPPPDYTPAPGKGYLGPDAPYDPSSPYSVGDSGRTSGWTLSCFVGSSRVRCQPGLRLSRSSRENIRTELRSPTSPVKSCPGDSSR